MPDRQLRIVRDATELGTLSEADARELLQIGFLKPTDLFACEGVEEPQPLGRLHDDASPERRGWVGAVRQSVTRVTGAVAGSAGDVAGKLKSLVTTSPGNIAAGTSKLLDGYTAQIKKVLANLKETRPLQAIRSGVRDDETMRKVFGAAYDCLPRPVCRFVSEERFLTYCMQHRARLLDLPENEKEGESA
jgi:hypothetical protein